MSLDASWVLQLWEYSEAGPRGHQQWGEMVKNPEGSLMPPAASESEKERRGLKEHAWDCSAPREAGAVVAVHFYL